MSANPVARPQSRRGILTAALAGTAASAATFGGHVVLAAVAEPDPIFAAIARERAAWRTYDAASLVYCNAEDAFRQTEFHRAPRVQIGEYVSFQRRKAGGGLEAVPEHEQIPEPVYLHDHAAIDRDCDRERDCRSAPALKARRARLHAELDADAAAIAKARAAQDEAERLSDEAHAAWKAEAAAMLEVAPTTIPGLLALVDRFEQHTTGLWAGEDEDGITQLVQSVRRLLTEVRA